MIGIVIAAHSDLAVSLLRAARLVVPDVGEVSTVSIDAVSTSLHDYELKLETAIAEVESGQGVLLLTDMFGGTPSNVGMTLHQPGKVEMITGVNLPMLVKALQAITRNNDLDVAARSVKAAAQNSIAIATEVLSGNVPGPKTQDGVAERSA